MYEKIQETASWLKERMTTSPETAIILGTGLGQLATEITDSYEFSYKDIPNFPVSTVEGHAGKLIFGKLGGKDIMAMEGRFHYYEGYSMKEVTFPIRVMYELPIKVSFMLDQQNNFNEKIISYVRKNSRNSILAKRKDEHKSEDCNHSGNRSRTISFRNN